MYEGPGSITVADGLPRPTLRSPREAVVRVSWSGICGTDLHPYRGEIPAFAGGTILGHEFAGTVVEAGAQTSFQPGDRVFASDIVACGRCRLCSRGWHYQCPSVSLFGYSTVVGESLDGGQAEYVRVPFADVVLAAIPDGVSAEQALFVGDVLTTAYAAVEAAGIVPGDTVAVVGAGPLGVLAAMCASAVGAGEVLVAEPDAKRRKLAAEAGVRALEPAEFSDTVRSACGGYGAPAVIEAVGSDPALTTAIDAAGPHGTVVAVGAHHSTAFPLPTREAFGRELTLRFVVGDPIRLRDRVFALLRAGLIDPVRVVTHRLPLSDAAKGYELLDRREALKVLLRVDEPHR